MERVVHTEYTPDPFVRVIYRLPAHKLPAGVDNRFTVAIPREQLPWKYELCQLEARQIADEEARRELADQFGPRELGVILLTSTVVIP